MSASVEIEARVVGRKRRDLGRRPLSLRLSPGAPVSLRDLLADVVRAEIEAFSSRQEDNAFLRVLTDRQITEAAESGRVTVGGSEVGEQHVDVEAAVGVALQAYEDGLYEVIVDDEPVKGLDAVVSLHAGSHILFLRLVALVGG